MGIPIHVLFNYFLFFFFQTRQTFLNLLCAQNFLCDEEAKIEQHSFLEKKLCVTGKETIWESRFTCIFNSLLYQIQ